MATRLAGTAAAAAAAAAGAPLPGVSSSGASFAVATYNVLSQELAKPDAYSSLPSDALRAATRMPRIISKLNAAVSAGAVVCLQEVSVSMCGALHAYFAQRGYHFVHCMYSSRASGYMGVGIAVPLTRFAIAEGDTMTPAECWSAAMERHNMLISVKLAASGRGADADAQPPQPLLSISTYHMPCMFWSPRFMNIHAAAAAQVAERHAGGLPFVLAGDFNFKPDAGTYKLVTTGSLPDDDLAAITRPRGMTSNMALRTRGLRSAYAVVNGSEPEYTNWSESSIFGSFVGTLDYVFVSDGVSCHSADLCVASGDRGPYPSLTEPSDHVMILVGAELS